MARSRVIGANRLRRKLNRMPLEVVGRVRQVIAEESAIIVHDMWARAPVSSELPRGPDGQPRPHVRDIIESRPGRQGLQARIGILRSSAASRAAFMWRGILWPIFLEFGTKQNPHPRPFIFPAWRARKDRTLFRIRRAVKDAVDAVARSRLSDG